MKSTLPMSCLLSLGTGSPWEGPSLWGQPSPDVRVSNTGDKEWLTWAVRGHYPSVLGAVLTHDTSAHHGIKRRAQKKPGRAPPCHGLSV